MAEFRGGGGRGRRLEHHACATRAGRSPLLPLNRRVQEAACGAVATFLEEGEPERHMAPYLPAILQTFAAALQVGRCRLGGARLRCREGGALEGPSCRAGAADAAHTNSRLCPPKTVLPVLQRYGRKAMRHAYDAISTAAESAPGLLSQPALAGLILPQLFGKLDTLPDGDRELLPLMECLTSGGWAGGRAGEEAALLGPALSLCPLSSSPLLSPSPTCSGVADGRRLGALRRRLLLPLHRPRGARGAGEKSGQSGGARRSFAVACLRWPLTPPHTSPLCPANQPSHRAAGRLQRRI